MAHQFGLGENEAKALESLAETHLKYRSIYLAAWRTDVVCGLASQSTTKMQLQQINKLQEESGYGSETSTEKNPLARLLQCSAQGIETSIGLKMPLQVSRKIRKATPV